VKETRQNGTPRWRDDFPVQAGSDSYTTRREFTKFLGLTSIAFVFGTFVAATRKIWKQWYSGEAEATAVTGVSELEIGSYKLFRYPTEDEPCILLRRTDEEFVAFNQNCSHLACPVHFDADTDRLLCPCHVGVFSARDGSRMAGPPRRGLEALTVEVRDDTVWVSLEAGEPA
jgi:Rieske Fe-S protein